MKQTLVSTSIVFIFLVLMVTFGNINCSDESSVSQNITQLSNNIQKKQPTLYKVPDENTPLNTFIPSPNYTEPRGDEACKMQLCFCCEDKGRYYEIYDVGGGSAVGSYYSEGTRCASTLANFIKGHSYVVYEFNVNCPEEDNPPTYFTACTCEFDVDIDTIRCCPEAKL